MMILLWKTRQLFWTGTSFFISHIAIYFICEIYHILPEKTIPSIIKKGDIASTYLLILDILCLYWDIYENTEKYPKRYLIRFSQ
ncbi:hypothetical protein ADM99_12310 [Leptolinea tardivitalis]|uniref:Uncharacterized protein n=1 Tax=Leptolinea tardivitalis TaxID=229920 RepID=A0A0N8GKZ3_9CHLR|nr:hypothetical protein ADM99_12310 [Leptolinea tardivitalis]